jgi:hypothetical protein
MPALILPSVVIEINELASILGLPSGVPGMLVSILAIQVVKGV